jgi:predicted transcriptional regulator
MSELQSEKRSVSEDVLRLTAEVVAAYVRNNPLPAGDLPQVIRAVHGSLTGLETDGSGGGEMPKPAVPINKSITPNYIVCLEDGRKLKMLKRHLRAVYNLTPEEYRARWGLPSNYPMVAPSYAKQRSEFAKKIGLGRSPAGRKKSS